MVNFIFKRVMKYKKITKNRIKEEILINSSFQVKQNNLEDYEKNDKYFNFE